MIVTSDLVYWLALSDKKHLISPKTIEKIFMENQSIKSLWNARPDDLRMLGFADSAVASFLKYRNSAMQNTNYYGIVDSAKQEGIYIKQILGKFGVKSFKVIANIYPSKIDKEMNESKTKKQISTFLKYVPTILKNLGFPAASQTCKVIN